MCSAVMKFNLLCIVEMWELPSVNANVCVCVCVHAHMDECVCSVLTFFPLRKVYVFNTL